MKNENKKEKKFNFVNDSEEKKDNKKEKDEDIDKEEKETQEKATNSKSKKVSKEQNTEKIEEKKEQEKADLENKSNERKNKDNLTKKEVSEDEDIRKPLYIGFELRIVLMVIGIIVLFSGACYLMLEAFNFGEDKKINYSEISNTDYRVCLDNNDYYNSNCLSSGMQYVSELVKTIKVNYDYNVDFSEEVNYDMAYHVVANLKIYDQTTNNVLYENEDLLIENTQVKGNGNNININDSVALDYTAYNQYVTSYKTNYAVNAKASLTVLLYIDDDSESRVASSIIIPIGESTFSIKNDDLKLKNQTIELDSNTWENYNNICAFLGAFLGLICLMLIVKLTSFVVKSVGKKTKYEATLKRILRDYDQVIVVARNGYESNIVRDVVKVESFKELLDARDNLNKPIIFSKVNPVKCEFIVEDESVLYKYVMKEADFTD